MDTPTVAIGAAVAKPAGPVSFDQDGTLRINLPEWMAAINTPHKDAAQYIAAQLACYAGRGPDNAAGEVELGFLTQTVSGIEPRDHVELLLATQMAAVHQLTMTTAAKAKRADTLPKSEVYQRQTNQLMRTFAAQAEALKRYRTGGKQVVKVKHVHVHEGGQAIVGNVEGGRKGGG